MEFEIALGLTVMGIVLLVFSILFTFRIIRILSINYYERGRWFLVILLLLGFVGGYGLLIATLFKYVELPIDPLTVVSIVYFFGAVFTVVTLAAVRRMLISILGSVISNKQAKEIFIKYAGIREGSIDIDQQFKFDCEHCGRPVNYTVADIVRSNITALDRGMAVEDIFGTKSFILRPTHRCQKGRREYNIVHDKDLEIRSIEGSRIIFGGQL